MNVYQKLSNIQNELVVTKNQRNTFGNYNYRSAEDILEASKPVCKAHNCVLVVSDEIVSVGGWNYVKATATLIDLDNETTIEVSASARESETKKGMDAAQITGAASSYARKYALGGLFNLDDNKDADATNKHEKQDLSSTMVQRDKIQNLIDTGKVDQFEMFKYYGITKLSELKFQQAEQVLKNKGGK